MRFDLGTLDSGERSLPFGLLVFFFFVFFFLLFCFFVVVFFTETCFFFHSNMFFFFCFFFTETCFFFLFTETCMKQSIGLFELIGPVLFYRNNRNCLHFYSHIF